MDIMDIVVLFLSIGIAKVAADLTPSVRGPGYIAFALCLMFSTFIHRWVLTRRRNRARNKQG